MDAFAATLLIADDPTLRRLKRLYLEQAGYAVEEALDGPAALDRLHDSPLPLDAIMNVRVPGLGAADSPRAARDDAELGRNVFMLITAMADMLPEAVVRLTGKLRVPILGKPLTAESLRWHPPVAGRTRHPHGGRTRFPPPAKNARRATARHGGYGTAWAPASPVALERRSCTMGRV
jgi:CheY-like chemotaxis protein